jgi:hypothetical protein
VVLDKEVGNETKGFGQSGPNLGHSRANVGLLRRVQVLSLIPVRNNVQPHQTARPS